MDIRSSKLLYLGLPVLLLVLYIVFIPSPTVSKIHIENNLGYIAEGYDFTILNLHSPSQIAPVSSYALPYWIRHFTMENGIAYIVTGDNSLHIIDASDPINLRKLSSWNSPGLVHSVAVEGNFAFLASHTDGIRVLGVQNTLHPYQILQISEIGTVLDVAAAQNLIYVARGSDGLDIYDISNISKPERKGHYDGGNSINRVTLLPDGKALLQIGKQDFQIINLSNPQNIILTNTFTNDNEIVRVVVNNNRIFVVQKSAGVLIVRIKEDSTLERLTTIPTPRNALDAALIDNTIFIAAGSGGVQAVDISKIEEMRQLEGYSRFWEYKGFIGFFVAVTLIFWLAFFSQFVLPVRTFTDRQKIFNRLITYLVGRHGPAIFIENGQLVKEPGEEDKKGPGVLWLDSASAAVIRTAVAVKRTIGPGVHFTEKGEYIAGTVDLHIQSQSLGPKESDKPFEEKKEGQSDEEYIQVQNRRRQVSALTRDGIEVIPNISVTFRVDTGLPEEGQSGSRFGYRTGNRKKDKDDEEIDKKAIEKAIILGEGVNPDIPQDKQYQRVAWNKLPALIAVDVWREYLAKFTLDELFEQSHELPNPQPQTPQPTVDETSALSQPIRMGAKRDALEEGLTSMLRESTKLFTAFIKLLENKGQAKNPASTISTPVSSSSRPSAYKKPEKKTALQMINYMVKARMTMPTIDSLNEHGRLIPTKSSSKEYELLKRRGIKVLNVSISNLQFDEQIEDQFIRQWTANWLNNAKAERDQIDRRRSYIEAYGQEEAIRQYATALSREILRKRPSNPKDTLKTLILRSWFEIMNKDHMLRKMTTEKQDLEHIIKWLEISDP